MQLRTPTINFVLKIVQVGSRGGLIPYAPLEMPITDASFILTRLEL